MAIAPPPEAGTNCRRTDSVVPGWYAGPSIAPRLYTSVGPQLARSELREQAGSQLDPAVVAALLAELDGPTRARGDGVATGAEERGTLAAEIASHVRDLLHTSAP